MSTSNINPKFKDICELIRIDRVQDALDLLTKEVTDQDELAKITLMDRRLNTGDSSQAETAEAILEHAKEKWPEKKPDTE